MVSSASVLAMSFTALVSLVLPVALAVFFCMTRRMNWRLILTGLSVFSVTQVFIRMPLLNLLSATEWYAAIAQNLWLLGIVLALSAALLENWGRYFGARFFAKGCSAYRDGLAYGLGHGGIEAFIVMGMNSFNNLYLALAVNNGTLDAMAENATAEQIEIVRAALVDTPASHFLMAGVERLMVMIIQVALSVVVFYAIRTGRKSYVWVAVAAHFVVDYPIVVLQNSSMWLVEGFIAACAAVGVVVIVKMRRAFAALPDPQPPAKQ